MTVPPHEPNFSPRAAFLFLSVYFLALAVCVVVPRALSFLPSTVALSGLIYLYARHRMLPKIDKTLAVFFAAFSALACLSSFWSPDPEYGFEKALKTSALLLSGLIPLAAAGAIPPFSGNKNKIAITATCFCAIAGFALAFEYTSHYSITRFLLGIDSPHAYDWPAPIKKGFLLNRSSVFLVLLSMPVALMLKGADIPRLKKYAFGIFLLSGIFTLGFTSQSQTALIAALLFFPALAFPAGNKAARRTFLLLLLGTTIAAPFIISPLQKLLVPQGGTEDAHSFLTEASIPHRFEVWTFVSEQIMTSPIFGQGIEATRHMRAGYIMPHMRADHVLHPHNAILQIWIEFGLAGIVLLMVFFCVIVRRIGFMRQDVQRYALAFFIVLLAVLSMGYGLWQAWLIGMIQTLVAVSMMAARLFDGQTKTAA